MIWFSSFQSLFLLERGLPECDDFLRRLFSSMAYSTFVQERAPPFRVCDVFDDVYGSVTSLSDHMGGDLHSVSSKQLSDFLSHILVNYAFVQIISDYLFCIVLSHMLISLPVLVFFISSILVYTISNKQLAVTQMRNAAPCSENARAQSSDRRK